MPSPSVTENLPLPDYDGAPVEKSTTAEDLFLAITDIAAFAERQLEDAGGHEFARTRLRSIYEIASAGVDRERAKR